jgi:hypothetical protein
MGAHHGQRCIRLWPKIDSSLHVTVLKMLRPGSSFSSQLTNVNPEGGIVVCHSGVESQTRLCGGSSSSSEAALVAPLFPNRVGGRDVQRSNWQLPTGTVPLCRAAFLLSYLNLRQTPRTRPPRIIAPPRPHHSLMLRTSLRSVRALGSRPAAQAAGRQWQAAVARQAQVSAQV